MKMQVELVDVNSLPLRLDAGDSVTLGYPQNPTKQRWNKKMSQTITIRPSWLLILGLRDRDSQWYTSLPPLSQTERRPWIFSLLVSSTNKQNSFGVISFKLKSPKSSLSSFHFEEKGNDTILKALIF
ncbi:hypothetical protein YC2023_073506 [Brassica napus]